MAISATLVTSNSWVSGSTMSTISFTSVTNNYYLVWARVASGNTPPSSVTSTNGITFSSIQSGGGALGCFLYGGLCTSGSSGTITITTTFTGQSGDSFLVIGISGCATSGTVVQSATLASGTGTALSASLSAFSSGINGTLVFANWAVSTLTPEGGYTALPNTLTAGGYAGVKTTPDTTLTATLGLGGTWQMTGVEIKALDVAYGTAPATNSLSMLGMGV